MVTVASRAEAEELFQGVYGGLRRSRLRNSTGMVAKEAKGFLVAKVAPIIGTLAVPISPMEPIIFRFTQSKVT